MRFAYFWRSGGMHLEAKIDKKSIQKMEWILEGIFMDFGSILEVILEAKKL